MKKPETYTELVTWFNCQQIKKYYNISEEDLEKIYFLVSKGWNVNSNLDVLNLVDPSGNMQPIRIWATCIDSSIDRISIVSGDFRVFYPASYYSSSSFGGSSSNNNNNNNNNH